MQTTYSRSPEYQGLIRGGVAQAYERTHAAIARNLPDAGHFMSTWRGHTAIIVGGGPSLQSSLGFIKRRLRMSQKTIVIAPNKSHDWLISKGIVPDIGVMMDPGPWLVDYMTPRKDVLYFLGSTVHPSVLDKFQEAGATVILTVYAFDPDRNERAAIEQHHPGRFTAIISGASTSGLRSIVLGTLLGVDDFILCGFDSCNAPKGGKLYAYDKPVISPKVKDVLIRCKARNASFRAVTNDQMRVQVDDFSGFIRDMHTIHLNGRPRPPTIRAHGDGAIPWLCFQAGEEAREAGLIPEVDHIDPERMRRKYRDHGHYDYAEDVWSEQPPPNSLLSQQMAFEETLADVRANLVFDPEFAARPLPPKTIYGEPDLWD